MFSMIILVMMMADISYDGAHLVQLARLEAVSVAFRAWEPAGSVAAIALQGAGDTTLAIIAHLGFWTHTSLVVIFLNLLPYSKHFHIITAVPNVFLQDLEPVGRLVPIEDIEGKVEREETLGIRKIEQPVNATVQKWSFRSTSRR